MYGMAIALMKPCVKLFSLPQTLLMPLILPICVLGAFAVNLNYFDVYVMLIAGSSAIVLHRFGFPLAPMVLAVILGPLADENLRRALLVFEDVGVWNVLWERKLGTVLLVVVLYTFYDGIFQTRKTEKLGTMTRETLDGIGLAIVGCGTIGRIRARIARALPGRRVAGSLRHQRRVRPEAMPRTRERTSSRRPSRVTGPTGS